MDALSANEAKSHFGDMLLKVQRAPVQINKNGKPVAVVMSIDDYQIIETIKLHHLQSRATQAMADIEAGKSVDGDAFFEALESGRHD